MRKIYYCVLLIVVFCSRPSLAVVKCDKPDNSFSNFLTAFEENKNFQRQRVLLPLVYREGEYQMTNFSVHTWDMEKIKELKFPLIYSSEERKREGISETITVESKGYIEIYHDGPPEADLYRLLYKFRNIDGCWFLEELHDRGL